MISKSSKNKHPFRVKCWPILSDGTKSDHTYELIVEDMKDIKDAKLIWKTEKIQ